MIRICPSIASCDVMNLEKTAILLEQKYRHIHVDIEDGNYINNITFGMKVLKGIRKKVQCGISVHLMVTDPLQYLAEITAVHPEIVFFHPDCTRYPSMVVNAFADKGIKVGLAFNPACSVNDSEYLMKEKIESVLIMMCEPDGNGQAYIEKMEDKVRYCVQQGWDTWVDGAVTDRMLHRIEAMGVKSVVMGRAVFEKL